MANKFKKQEYEASNEDICFFEKNEKYIFSIKKYLKTMGEAAKTANWPKDVTGIVFEAEDKRSSTEVNGYCISVYWCKKLKRI